MRGWILFFFIKLLAFFPLSYIFNAELSVKSAEMLLIEIITFLLTFQVYRAFDPFIGLLHQGKPCFETIEFKDCSTTLPQAYTPSYNGTNTNVPDTKLWLFTATNPDKAEPLHKCGGKLPENSGFDRKQETIIIIPGALENICNTAWEREFKDQFFNRGNYNVILIDWTWGNAPDVVGAVINAHVVGEQIAFVIKNIMVQNNYADGSKFYIISHSAGTFAAVTAGRFVRKWKPSHKLRRITLLEPAPLFLLDDAITHNTSYREAHFVDVYHTNGGTCSTSSFGVIYPSGHADFYINGGTFQLSCYPEALTAILKGDILYALGSILIPPLCSHFQVVQYFKVSINYPAGLQIGAMCDNYESFLFGACKRCCKTNWSDCAVAGFDAEHHFPHKNKPRKVRKYYYTLGLECPYNENYNFSIYKDC